MWRNLKKEEESQSETERRKRTGKSRPCLAGRRHGSMLVSGSRAADEAHGGRRRPSSPTGGRKGVSAVSSYIHEVLKELADQQVRFAPPQRRLEQLKRTERLLAE